MVQMLFFNREEEEAEKFLGKIEDVNKMLGQLMSKDDKEVGPTWWEPKSSLSVYFLQAAEAEDRIDKFLEVQSKEEADRAQRAQVDQRYFVNGNVSCISGHSWVSHCRE